MKRHFTIPAAVFFLSLYNHLIAQTNTVTKTANEPAVPSQKRPVSKTEHELRKIEQELMDADTITNEKAYKQVGERYLADNFISVSSAGRVETIKEALDFNPPRPSEQLTESLEDMQVKEYGDNAAVALLTGKTSFVENGQTLTRLWRVTKTYIKQNGQWKVAASHASIMPNPNQAIKIDPSIYDAYVGEYQLNDDFLTVSRNGDKLMGQTTSASGKKFDFEFLPASETQFFIRDLPDQVTFVKGDQGKVSYILHRHSNGQEVKEMKVK